MQFKEITVTDSEGTMVQLQAADGFRFEAFEVSAGANRRGGIVILQEIFGVTGQLKGVARAYAKHGFDAIVPALFDRAAPNTVVPFGEPDRGRDTMNSLDKAKTLLDIAAAIARVDHGKGVSVMGYCWGGGLALRCAGEFGLKASVAFYGTALVAHMAALTQAGKAVTCPMQFHFGATDTHSPAEVIEAVRKGVPAADVHVYQAGHAFANEARAAVYVEEASKTAHARTLAFLQQAHPV